MNRIQNINKLRQLYQSNNESEGTGNEFVFNKKNAANYKSTTGFFSNKTSQPFDGVDALENKNSFQYSNVINSKIT